MLSKTFFVHRPLRIAPNFAGRNGKLHWFCAGQPEKGCAESKKKPTKKWARNTGSNVSNVVLNT
jgi:hypothetical protein